MLPQTHITANTPMGATLVPGGATFRAWAPGATAVYVNGVFGGVATWDQTDAQLMSEDAGYWTGFVSGAQEGDPYKFYVAGAPPNKGYKRDPYARELATDVPFPNCNCIVRDPSSYPWHDAGFRSVGFSDMVIYQLHVGAFTPPTPGTWSTFLDVLQRIDYIAALGINMLQLLPIDEAETWPSKGYNGCDIFSPDMPYVVDAATLQSQLPNINRLFANRGGSPLTVAQLTPGANQLKALVDICHLYGIGVAFDVVYNHAGGFTGDDDSIYFWDRAAFHSNNDSQYFTDRGWAGGLSFALWNQDVRAFLINNARFFIDEYHVDGFRYDEVSALVGLNGDSGWRFCQDLTSTLRFQLPRLLQNAEFWPVNGAVLQSTAAGGAGFDVIQHDGLRNALRAAVAQASYGNDVPVNFDAIGASVADNGVGSAWQAVTCVENHDLTKAPDGARIAAMADNSNHRSVFTCGRTRFATGILLTAPGIPMLFMGQEFLEDKDWSDSPSDPGLYWAGLNAGEEPMKNQLRFTQDLVRLRNNQPALRGASAHVFHVHNGNRVIAFHRWIEGVGQDVIVVASLNDNTFDDYVIGFPQAGFWKEIFNSDVYENWVNPQVKGNNGGITAEQQPMHGFSASAHIVIPARGTVVFARQ
jgi:1,4-alpha-glucan branching enzyme